MSKLLWKPSQARVAASNMTAFMTRVNQHYTTTLVDYPHLHEWSVNHRPEFWSLLSEFYGLRWHHQPKSILENDQNMPGAEWFKDATLNYAEHLLTRRDHKPAIIFRGEQGQRRVISYLELYQQVAQVAAQLKQLGVTTGDRVAGYLPNCPEAIIAMLATASLGAVWTSCSPDFGWQGALDRFDQIKPKALFTVDGYFYNGKHIDIQDKVFQLIQNLNTLEQTIIISFANPDTKPPSLPNISVWQDWLNSSHSTPDLTFTPVPFNAPLCILYSSGTTGKPKCIIHSVGGTLLQHLKELGLHTDLKDDDVFFYFTTCGWMMWNWQVSALALGLTLVIYDGSPFYPTPAILFDIVETEDVSVFGTSAKYLSALQKQEVIPAQRHTLSALRTLLSTGSPLADDSFDYVYRDIKQDICLSSISGGTDIISCFALGCPILPVYRGELQCIGLGMDVVFMRNGDQAKVSEKGELVCRQNFPSMPIGFWDDPDRQKYHAAYFSQHPGQWSHGDFGEITEHGGVVIHGRADAVLNPGGVRIGTAEIYRQVEAIPEVLECIAVCQDWQGDSRIVLFVKLKPALSLSDDLVNTIKQTIRQNTTPRHVPAKVLQVNDIPRTRSGKIVEVAVRETIHDRPVKNTDALANPEALEYFKQREELLCD
ncbi:acetoacetate--CoA ligase [Zooshikella ganghwensis]|uniref:Acetoacetate--CoA ligase n=1 Tax=Zooshikella ganghwensis TaxID=202772 RepID=A0A4P9VPM3_9GAMM|nr:acetoacetate--CoA ligase [Zooshikella ganghwensis]RDH44324.1 acetoacetate--CoA ligase [Zooshikella ganghwensis]